LPVPSTERLEALLAQALGQRVIILGVERPGPWAVMACRLDTAPGSVIVKWLSEDRPIWRADPRQMADECAALEFLSVLAFPHAPRLIVADPANGVVIMQDLGSRTSLADRLRRCGVDESADALRAFAGALGALGAATAGKSAAHDVIRDRLGPRLRRAEGLGEGWPPLRAQLESLGHPLTTAAERDLAWANQTLVNPGAFRVLTNGDPESNNFLLDPNGTGGDLIDFEFAAYRHALTCAVGFHVPGPAWITVTHPLGAEMEATYRRALSAAIPQAADDHMFGAGLAAACLGLACVRMERFATLDARPAGEASRVQMISTLEAAVGVAHARGVLIDAAGWMDGLAQWLRRRWPDADVDLGGYAAYTPRS